MALWPEGLGEDRVEEQYILIERVLAGSWETGSSSCGEHTTWLCWSLPGLVVLMVSVYQCISKFFFLQS